MPRLPSGPAIAARSTPALEPSECSLKAGVPFVVGGAYAYATYTGIYRDTKDLDLFPRKRDAVRALEVLEKDGWRTERTDEVWLYKAFKGEYFVDFIFSSGNGVADGGRRVVRARQDGPRSSATSA